MRKTRIFVDMDGTIANFHEHNDCLEQMHKPGYFQNLNPFVNSVNALKLFSTKPNTGTEIYVLSAVSGAGYDRVVEEKKTWLKNHGIFLDDSHLLFPLIGASKVQFVKLMTNADITDADILLDDYNENLEEWRRAGGTAIKFVNNFNDKGKNGPLWNGKRIRHDWLPEHIFSNLSRILTPQDVNIEPMSKNGNMAYWDDIDNLTEGYVKELLDYSVPTVEFGDEFENKDDVIMRLAKEVTEFTVNLLESDVGATFPYVEGDY